jgi:large subunit ribosomal protein L32
MVVHMRHTRGHTNNRRSHHALKAARFMTCQKCKAKHLMHRACGNCGSYRGRLVVDVLKKTVKAQKRAEKKTEGKK